MIGRLATNFVVRQLNGGQWRHEQFGDADHVVIAEHSHIVGNFQATTQQQLVRAKGNAVVAADQDVELRATVDDVPIENGGGFTIGIVVGKVVMTVRAPSRASSYP